MKKINLESCMVTIKTEQGKQEIPYDIQDSMVDVLMHPELKLNGTKLLRNNRLAEKILASTTGFILLEEADYSLLKEACERIQGFDRQDIELVRRILEAPTVEVEEKA